MPDLVLSPPTGLNIQGNPVTVEVDTPLSQLLKPDMGKCHWAACTYNPLEGESNLVFTPTGIGDRVKKKYVKVY